jgi:hypothetical protein
MNSNFCKNLRTKKMYIPAQADEIFSSSPEEASQQMGHCWCNRTMSEVGPDDRQVGAQSCSKAQLRSCFEE